MEILESLFQELRSYGHLGERRLDNGTHLIGRAPHIGTEAWLHIIFPPITEEQLISLESAVGAKFPMELQSFLRRCNGLNMFSDQLSLDGFRHDFVREGDAAIQPYSILTPNLFERPINTPKSFVFIGGYSSDGSRLALDSETGGVCKCKKRTAIPLTNWNSFESFLTSEYERLSTMFDGSGRKLL